MSERGDGDLVRAVLAGERMAFGELVRRHQATLQRRAAAIVGDPDMAADMVQESFIRAYEKLADCRKPDRFGGCVYRLVRNRCLDELRSPRTRAEPLPAALEAEADPVADFERAQLGDQIARALDGLSATLREAFVMRHLEGLSYDEMKEATGASASALKMRIKRARDELATVLADRLEPDVTRSTAATSDE